MVNRSQRHLKENYGKTSLDPQSQQPAFPTYMGSRMRASVNDLPTDIALSTPTVLGTAAVNTIVGTLTTVNGDAPFTYTLLNDDSANFDIAPSGNQIRKIAATIGAGTRTIQVKSTDIEGDAFTKNINITVT